MLWVWVCWIPLTPLNLKESTSCDWRSSAGQTADLYIILLDEESRCLWVIALPTCSPKPTQNACFSSLVEGKDWLWDAQYTD